MTRFITLAGRKQVGKDTSAHIIARIIGRDNTQLMGDSIVPLQPRVHIVHFADALKDACVLIFGIDRQDMETEDGKKKLTDILWPAADDEGYFAFGSRENVLNPCAGKPMTVREVLQFVGTDLFRTQIDPDIWVKSVFKRKYGEDDIVIIADARFPNEAAFAKKNGLLVKIERNNGLVGDMHISERALDDYTDYDFVVDNNDDLVVLKQKWLEILRGQNIIA